MRRRGRSTLLSLPLLVAALAACSESQSVVGGRVDSGPNIIVDAPANDLAKDSSAPDAKDSSALDVMDAPAGDAAKDALADAGDVTDGP